MDRVFVSNIIRGQITLTLEMHKSSTRKKKWRKEFDGKLENKSIFEPCPKEPITTAFRILGELCQQLIVQTLITLVFIASSQKSAIYSLHWQSRRYLSSSFSFRWDNIYVYERTIKTNESNFLVCIFKRIQQIQITSALAVRAARVLHWIFITDKYWWRVANVCSPLHFVTGKLLLGHYIWRKTLLPTLNAVFEDHEKNITRITTWKNILSSLAHSSPRTSIPK